jgi:hypothetical protein
MRTRLNALLPARSKADLREGKLSKITTIDGVVQVTFLDVTDDANVFDTSAVHCSICAPVEPDLDVKSGEGSTPNLAISAGADVVRHAAIWPGSPPQ